MMTPEQTKEVNKIIKPMRQIVQNCTNLIENRKHSMVGNNSLVEMPGHMFVKMETEFNEELKVYQATKIDVVTDPTKASHFTPEDALNVARDCTNGVGEKGCVVTWKTACELTIERYEKTIQFIIERTKEASDKANKLDQGITGSS